jgi:serine/threonine protein kinase
LTGLPSVAIMGVGALTSERSASRAPVRQSPKSVDVLALKARQRIGKYRIERRLNDGPLAAVYEAVDTIHGVRVALKIPHESAMSEDFLVDFKREARLAQRLEHPNILPIRDASYIEGRFVIAMPLGERSLTSRMRQRISTEGALQFIDQALAAVAHAHQARSFTATSSPITSSCSRTISSGSPTSASRRWPSAR